MSARFFCPTCGNLLFVEANKDRHTRWFCQTCPYVCIIKKPISYDVELKKKDVDDVMGGDEQWANAESIEVKCTKVDCTGDRAFFQMFQTRSADEPMTQFFKCCKCGHQWKEG